MNAREAGVLVVDDDIAIGTVLVSLLKQADLQARFVPSAEEALKVLATETFDVVITDVRMKKMDGLALLKELRLSGEDVPVIVLTAHGTIALAVEAMRAGAADFLTKPFDRDEIIYTVKKAVALTAHAATAPPDIDATGNVHFGSSPAMREVADLVRRAAKSVSNVLLRGESGSGKEVVARTIHQDSPRAKEPFVAINCAAVPVELLESEIFGYERGAFTGAVARRPGRIELARGGTFFLDEIGDVPLAAQAKLLRLLQEKEYQPLGGTRTEKADVRFLAATHRDLEAMIGAGTFREDLYYRLNVIPIWLPPLRDRGADLVELAARFTETLGKENGRAGLKLTREATERLAQYSFPGNVRELLCLIERLVVFTDGNVIDEVAVGRELERIRVPRVVDKRSRIESSPDASDSGDPKSDRTSSLTSNPTANPAGTATSLASRRNDAEREAVLDALQRSGKNRTQAARLLGVSRRTLYNRLTALGLIDA